MSFNPDNNNISAVLISSDNSWNLNGDGLNVFERPDLTVFFCDGITYISEKREIRSTTQHPLELIEIYVRSGFFAVGYISYNYLVYTDVNVDIRHRNYTRFPDIHFSLYRGDTPSGKNEFSNYLRDYNSKHYLTSNIEEISISEIHRAKYIQNVEKILYYIEKGDVYQVNLSHFISVKAKIDPLDLFVRYYKEQPVPYAMYLRCQDFYFLSGSMELFLKRTENKIQTKPIKGTKRRGSNIPENAKLKRELQDDIKERAENLMIVDLMRNDLSRICTVGTVKVNELFSIKTYSTLFQMESSISGILNDDISFKDIIHNVFPPGSVTGAPKKRSVQIIDELEEHYRGPYCGCAGVLKPDGGFTLSVSIRTGIISDSDMLYWAGSGIVSDSDPKREYLETLLKSKAFFNSIA